jgi:hypothetical protein
MKPPKRNPGVRSPRQEVQANPAAVVDVAAGADAGAADASKP